MSHMRRDRNGGDGYGGGRDDYRQGPRSQTSSDRGRTMERNSDMGFSSYFRDRFGSQSPEEYKNLRLSHIDPKVGNGDLRDVLEREFRRYGDHQVKVVNGNGQEERLAYVNFDRPDVAKRCRKSCLAKMQDLLGRYLKVDPAGVIRDQDGRFVDQSRAPPVQDNRRGRYDRSPPGTGGYRDEGGQGGQHRGGAGRQRNKYQRHSGPRDPPSCPEEMEDWKQAECEEFDATRTLFVGNLPARADDNHLRKLFGQYGLIEEVDIKSPHEGSDAVYSFIQFQNLDQSQEAKYYEDGQVVAGGKRCNIGYGKPVKTRRLFIGGLGAWTSIESLAKEFDRYGAIEKIEYIRGGTHAYALFVSGEAALEACLAMKGFPLGGPDRRLRVDFASVAEDEEEGPIRPASQQRRSRGTSSKRSRSRTVERRSETRSPTPKRRGPRTPPESPPPLSPGIMEEGGIFEASSLAEVGELDPHWSGSLILKKSAYAVNLHKLRGDDELINDRLRDPDSGKAIQLLVTQRRPFSQSSLGEFRKYLSAPSDTVAFFLAAPGAAADSRPLRDLVRYLADKSAGGVVNIKGSDGEGSALLYMFPHCDLSTALLEELAPRSGLMAAAPSDSLLAILVKNTKGK